MNYPFNIKSVHLELTDKCQAACPMCPRNVFGGVERSHIKNVEITLDQFKQWFPPEFLVNLDHVYACGNNGDPLLASDCLEIFQYLAEHTKESCLLDIHTNASLRSKEWWVALAQTLGKRGRVIFAVDGFKEDHELYRRNTNWDRVIENARTFIEAGGRAKADTIVFKHNQDTVEKLKEFLLSIGFEDVFLKPTHRFFGLEDYPVKDRNGNTEYYLQSPTLPQFSQNVLQVNFNKLANETVLNNLIDKSKIEPKCMSGRDLFVNAHGVVWPCCFVGPIMTDEHLPSYGNDFIVKEKLRLSAVELSNDIKVKSLHGTNILNLLRSSAWGETLPKHFTDQKKFICVKSCAVNLKELLNNDLTPLPKGSHW